MNYCKDYHIYKNPHLVTEKIDQSFYAVYNPLINNGLKVLNINQYEILESIESGDSLVNLAYRNNLTFEEILSLYKILEEKEFLKLENSFENEPKKGKITTLHLWVQTTNECNLRCSYCYIHTLGQKEYLRDSEISVFIEKLVETARNKNLKEIKLRFAGGEPLLKFNLWKSILPNMKERLSAVNCTLKVGFLSNAVALNDNIIEYMKNNAIGIGVSIDGLHKYQDASRHFANGKGSFDIVVKNIDKLKHNGLTPSLMTVISNSNLDGLEDFTKYVISRNLHCRYSFVSGENIDIEKLKKVLRRCYDIFESAIDRGYAFSRLHQLCDLKFDRLSFQTCSDGYNGGALYTNGDIYFCQRHFGAEPPVGSIFEEDDIISVIQRKSYYGEVNQECKQCKYRYVCTSGCPIERINNKDPHCEIYKEFIPTIIRLRGKERLIKIRHQYMMKHINEIDIPGFCTLDLFDCINEEDFEIYPNDSFGEL